MLKEIIKKIIIATILIAICVVFAKYIQHCIEGTIVLQLNKLKNFVEEQITSLNVVKKIFSVRDYLGKKDKN